MASLGELLEQTDAQIAIGDLAAALESLTAAWRAARCAPIAFAIRELGARVDQGLAPLAGPTKQRVHEQWLEICDAGRAVDVGRLLVPLLDGHSGVIEAKMIELAKRPPDPRVSAKLADVVFAANAIGASGSARKGWRSLFAVLRTVRDPQCRPVLEEASRRPHAPEGIEGNITFYEYYIDAVRKVLAGLESEAALDDSAMATLCSIRDRLGALAAVPVQAIAEVDNRPPATEDELLAMVAEAPDDDAPRQVLADFLLERGDPRGELMALQLRAHGGARLTKIEQKRVKELVKALARNVVGPLANVIDMKTARFERGMLAGCATKFRRAKQRDELVHHRLWATVEDLTTDEARLITGGAARGLKVLRAEQPVVEAICDTPAKLGIREIYLTMLAPDATSAIRVAGALPHLQKMQVSCARGFSGALMPTPDDLMWLLRGPVTARLAKFGVMVQYTFDLASWLRAFRDLPARPTNGFDLRHYSAVFTDIRLLGDRFSLMVGAAPHGEHLVRRAFETVGPELIDHIEVHDPDGGSLVSWLSQRYPGTVEWAAS